MVQCTDIYQCNPQHKQTQRKKPHGHFIRCWKSIWQISASFHVKVLERNAIQGTYINIVKAIYSKPVALIKQNGEKLETISLKSGTRQGCHLSPYLFNIVLEVLDRPIRQQGEVKGMYIWEEEVKLTLFAYDIILYLSNTNNSTREILQMINLLQQSGWI